ncbi:hypothetical protein TrLO_g9143 [Triparma laevis f. longispina]|uniref:Uncharacterized protein n=1 Tax=Triparma laevis f. longispina TaxID=1714387 RepID=A0A9W7E1K6_9STRA|nr:hypothetical protein TrLO_g9143 [Triparma laevis f. longispina]
MVPIPLAVPQMGMPQMGMGGMPQMGVSMGEIVMSGIGVLGMPGMQMGMPGMQMGMPPMGMMLDVFNPSNCGVSVVRAITKLRAKHAAAFDACEKCTFGVNGLSGDIVDMTTTSLYKPYAVKIVR